PTTSCIVSCSLYPYLHSEDVCLCASHPFPTRRSSDLFVDDGNQEDQARALLADRSAEPEDDQPLVLPNDLDRGADDRESDDQNRDRKSTRLNSSHGSISYAVFCLKKKNL